MTTKKQAIKKLNKVHEFYNLSAEVVSGENSVKYAKAFLQIFEKPSEPGKQPIIVKVATAYGFGESQELAQENAIVNAIENLGL